MVGRPLSLGIGSAGLAIGSAGLAIGSVGLAGVINLGIEGIRAIAGGIGRR